MLDIVASYHCIQFQGKLIIQSQEDGEKPHFGYNLGPTGPNSGQILFFFFFFFKIWPPWSLDIMVSYHHVQYQEKLMIQSWENLVMDEWMNRWTDRGTDGQRRVIGRCQTNVTHPITLENNKIVCILRLLYLKEVL